MSASAPVIIVTGASRGLGLAVAQEALKLGASVVAVSRSGNDEFQNQARVAVVTGDVTDPAVCENVLQTTLSKFGKIDAVVHNAGLIEPIAKIADANLDDWKRLMDVNLSSVVLLTQKCLPHLRKQKGRIVMVSSGAATNPYHGWSAYCCSKAAMNMLTACLAVEEPDVTSIAVRPGVVATDMQKIIRQKGEQGMRSSEHKFFIDLHEGGKLVPPIEPGHVIARLAVGPIDPSLNGEFFSWDSVELAKYRK